ncbi:MAG TPA: glutamyl-tRNA reductase [Acidobacteriota bacterium]|nr:glutamyl-tRNA reductase [Acidobacteriota bacterium]
MTITVTGLNHKSAPVEVRERLHISEEKIPDALRDLQKRVPEGLIFSTCNRFEVLSRQEDAEHARVELVRFISEQRGLDPEVFERYVYYHEGPDAVRHVFRVACSLDSMVVGEPQILGQLKQFFAMAQQEHTIGFTLNAVMERAFTVAKRIRTETQIASSSVSVSSVAVELAIKIFGKLDNKTALIVGAGKMSLHAIRHLKSRGIHLILVTNRTYQKAAEIAEQVQGRAVAFEDLPSRLSEADIVISSTGSTEFILRKEDVHRAMTLRKNRPIFFIDIAMPRDIDPRVNEIANTYVYDIDDLKNMADANRKEREQEAEKAEEIVLAEAESFWHKLKTHEIHPTIREIQSKIEELRKSEIERSMKKLGPLTEEQQKALEQLTSSLTSKILQSSFAELRHLSHEPDGLEKIELIRKLFKL